MFKFLKEWGKAFDKELLSIATQANFFPIIALAAAVVGTGLQTYSAIKQADAAGDAEKARRGAEETAAQRERLRAVREARIRRAEVASASEAQGASGSSGALGAQASIGTQLQANLGFVSAQNQAQRDISAASLAANRAGLIGSIGAGVGQAGASYSSFRQRQTANAGQERQATRVELPT